MSFFKKEKEIGAVASGTVIDIKEVNDQVFSSGLLGDGIGIKPTQGSIVSPVDGKIITTHDAGHAYSIMSSDGAELLIHVGIDTVELAGKHFYPKVKVGDKVKKGQLIVNADLEEIAKMGYDTTVALIISNEDEIEITGKNMCKCTSQSVVMTYKRI